MKDRDKGEALIGLEVRAGDTDATSVNWSDAGQLRGALGDHQIHHVWRDDRWDMELCTTAFGTEAAPIIMGSGCVISEGPDRLLWKGNSSGHFSVTSTWREARVPSQLMAAATQIWGDGTPSKCSILFWRMIQDKLPTDEAMKAIGFSLASKCTCCGEPQEETTPHIFSNDEIAKEVWVHFEEKVGVLSDGDSLMSRASLNIDREN